MSEEQHTPVDGLDAEEWEEVRITSDSASPHTVQVTTSSGKALMGIVSARIEIRADSLNIAHLEFEPEGLDIRARCIIDGPKGLPFEKVVSEMTAVLKQMPADQPVEETADALTKRMVALQREWVYVRHDA